MRALVTVLLPQNEQGQFPDENEIDNLFRFFRIYPTRLLSRDSFSKSGNEPNSQDAQNETQLSESSTDLEAIDKKYSKYEDYRRAYCLDQAKTILDRMPQHTEDEKRKLQQAKKSIVCASRLPESYAECAVFIETEGALLFRIHSQKTENLRKGCEEVISRIRSYNKKGNPPLVISPEIEIYEHGLEFPTITGQVIGDKWKALYDRASINVIIAIFSLIAFIGFSTLAYKSTDQFWNSYAINFSSAFFVSFCIAMISIINTYAKLIPLIEWDPEGKERSPNHS